MYRHSHSSANSLASHSGVKIVLSQLSASCSPEMTRGRPSCTTWLWTREDNDSRVKEVIETRLTSSTLWLSCRMLLTFHDLHFDRRSALDLGLSSWDAIVEGENCRQKPDGLHSDVTLLLRISNKPSDGAGPKSLAEPEKSDGRRSGKLGTDVRRRDRQDQGLAPNIE